MPTQTVISINRQTPIMGPATFYPRVVVERLPTTGYQRYIIKDGDFSVNDGVATTAKHILLFLALEYVGYIVGFAVFSGNGTTLKYLGELAGKTVGENTVPVFKIYDESKGEGIKVTLDVKTTSSVSVTDVS